MKHFLLDTSVILDSDSLLNRLYENGNNQLYITNTILEELEKHKTNMIDEVGFKARAFIRALNAGQIEKPHPKAIRVEATDKMSSVRFKINNKEVVLNIILRERFSSSMVSNDRKILEVAITYKDKITLLTNDGLFKIIAISYQIKTESIESTKVDSPEDIDFHSEYTYEIDAKGDNRKAAIAKFSENLKNNRTLELIGTKDGQIVNREYFVKINGSLKALDIQFLKSLKVKPINVEQKFYATLLASNFNIALATGATGSGKTLLALSEGIRRVKSKDSQIDGIVYLRNTVTANDKEAELGFRKGGEEEKLSYFAYPLMGAINFIDKEDNSEAFMQKYNIKIIDVAHARGTTISNKFIIFDELQNASLDTLKLIGTRVGKGSKLVLLGDYKQVDHPKLSKNRNALVSMLKIALEDDSIAAIQLRKTIRSDIADWFAKNI